MKSKVLKEADPKTLAVVFESGDEVASELARFAKDNSLSASHFTGIGALQDATLGYFEVDKKEYRRIRIHEQVEVLSLVGDIALERGEPTVHAHVVLGKSDGTAHGGHLLEAHVRPTLEVVIVESPAAMKKRFFPEFGLALIDLEA